MYSSGRSGRHSPDPTRGPLRVPVRKRPGSGARPYGVPLPLPAPRTMRSIAVPAPGPEPSADGRPQAQPPAAVGVGSTSAA